MKEGDLGAKIKEANRRFYDIVAPVYEEIDGRRTDEVIAWLSENLKGLSKETSGEVLLDFGCGSGVVSDCGRRYFKRTYGIDISPEILKIASEKADGVICGEANGIPLKDNSVDVIVCFAVLHHLFDHKSLLKEVYRVLKKGGILYTDHDMDKFFYDRFRLPLKVYRSIFNAGRRYMKARSEITEEMYRLSEIHSDGIDSNSILSILKEEGFMKVDGFYHWFGLNSLTNRLIKQRRFSKGSAPLFSIIAQK